MRPAERLDLLVEVRHKDGSWYDGFLERRRKEGDRWSGFVRYSVGMGLTHIG